MDKSKPLSLSACRVCLTADYQNKITMENENGWLECFEYCFGLQVTKEDQARMLCEECANNVKNFVKFKRKCLQSDVLWKAHLFLKPEYDEAIIKNDTEHKCKIDYDNHNYNEAIEYDNNIPGKKYDSADLELNENNILEISPEVTCISNCLQEAVLDTNDSANNNKEINCNYRNRDIFYKKLEDVSQRCGICEFSTKQIDILIEHLEDHFSRNDLECKTCDFVARDFAEMAYHRYSHQDCDVLFCHKCRKIFKTPKVLQFHFRTKHLNKKGGLCKYCDAVLSTVKTWRNHERRHANDGSNGKIFICNCCGLKFVFRNQIVEHLTQRAGLTRSVCDKCGAVFLRKSNLNSHIRNMHTKTVVPTKCPHCNKYIKNIRRHIIDSHGEKKFVCEVCSEGFRTKTLLDYHMLNHMNIRPHVCQICNKGYKTKSMLTVHLMKHTGEKPHICSVCHKGFATVTQLKVHASAHTRVRSCKCEYCDRTFHYKARLLTHCEKAHPDKT